MTVELHHGDARHLALKVQGPIHCIVTDPPYGQAHQSNFAKTERGKRFTREIEGDHDLDEALALFSEVMFPLVDQLAEAADVYVFTSWKVYPAWRELMEDFKPLEVVNTLIWEKGWPGLGDLDHNWPFSFEMILYMKKGLREIKNRRSSVLAIDRQHTSAHIHPSEKPVELIQALLEQSTLPGELVVDPFAGSGSTLVAAQRLGRRAIGFEKDESYHRDASARLTQPALF